MKLSELFNPFLWLKYKDKTNNGILYQTSYLKSYNSKTIQIENYLMKKLFLNIFFWNSYYFNLFRRLEPFLIPKLFDSFSFQEKVIDFEPQFFLLDGDEVIKGLTIAKDLLLIEVKGLQALISIDKPLNEDLNIYVLNKNGSYVGYSLDLLKDYSISDLRVVFGSISNGLALLKKFINQETRKEEEEFKKIFYFSRLEEKPLNSIILNKDYSIKFESLKNNPYYALFGSAGSGKSFLLFHILFNVLLSSKFKRIYVYDTQNLFNEYVNKLKYNYFKRLKFIQEQKGVYAINETNLYLTETEIINGLNLLLEEKGLISAEEKRKALTLNISNKSIDEIKKEVKQKIKELENRKDFKSLKVLELLKNVLLFLDVVKVEPSSIFETEAFLNGVFVFQFQKPFFYAFISYILFNELENILYKRKQGETFLFFDETQKYLESELLTEKLVNLMKEKRQYGLRVFYTALAYKDTSDLFKYTTNFIFNDLNDVYLRNMLVNKGIEPILNKPKEKVVTDSSFSNISKVLFEPFLFSSDNKNL